ncbi:MAG: SPOR domain-containing protein [Ginsengibacter sp.]
MKYVFIFCFLFVSLKSFTQVADTAHDSPKVFVHKDYRLDALEKKYAEINETAAKMAARSAMGYRLQVLSTNDRDLAMQTKSKLLQRFPEQKTYMFFQLPYVKLRFGNFKTREEAEKYRKQVSRMMDGASIYIVSERIEVKPEKEEEQAE